MLSSIQLCSEIFHVYHHLTRMLLVVIWLESADWLLIRYCSSCCQSIADYCVLGRNSMKESSLSLPMDAYTQGRRASDSGSHKVGNKNNLERLYNKAIGNNKSPATSVRQLQEELVSLWLKSYAQSFLKFMMNRYILLQHSLSTLLKIPMCLYY